LPVLLLLLVLTFVRLFAFFNLNSLLGIDSALQQGYSIKSCMSRDFLKPRMTASTIAFCSGAASDLPRSGTYLTPQLSDWQSLISTTNN
jgi:hypothetical protein